MGVMTIQQSCERIAWRARDEMDRIERRVAECIGHLAVLSGEVFVDPADGARLIGRVHTIVRDGDHADALAKSLREQPGMFGAVRDGHGRKEEEERIRTATDALAGELEILAAERRSLSRHNDLYLRIRAVVCETAAQWEEAYRTFVELDEVCHNSRGNVAATVARIRRHDYGHAASNARTSRRRGAG